MWRFSRWLEFYPPTSEIHTAGFLLKAMNNKSVLKHTKALNFVGGEHSSQRQNAF